MAAYGTPLTGCDHDSTAPVETSRGRGRDTERGWSIGPPAYAITDVEPVLTTFDDTNWLDPDVAEPAPPAPTCPPWKFGAQRDKRRSHKRTNKRGR